MLNKGLFTSLSGEWEIPSELFDELWEEHGGFDLDPCSQTDHYSAHKIVQHGGSFFDGSTPAMDGLSQTWYGKVYLNPPYGRAIGDWIWKCWSSVYYGDCKLVVALLPSRTDTLWWHNWVMEADEIRFIKGRLKFSGAKQGAPFPSCIVVWK